MTITLPNVSLTVDASSEASPFFTGPDNKAHYKRARAYFREQIKLRAAHHRAYHQAMSLPHDESQWSLSAGLRYNPNFSKWQLSVLHAAYGLLRERAFINDASRPEHFFMHGVERQTARLTLDNILKLTAIG